jgi:hypothetical protein
MQAAATGTRRHRHRTAMHRPVEESTSEGRTRIGCADPGCAAWDPQPCQSRREAEFWYDRHISQPLIHHL